MKSLDSSSFVCGVIDFLKADWFLSGAGGVLGGIVFIFIQWQFNEAKFFKHGAKRNVVLASIYILVISPIIALVLNLNPVVSGLLSGMGGPIALVSVIGGQLVESGQRNVNRSHDVER